jgi:hypothetical protein
MAEKRAGSIAAFRAVIRHRKVGRLRGRRPARGARIFYWQHNLGKRPVICKHVTPVIRCVPRDFVASNLSTRVPPRSAGCTRLFKEKAAGGRWDRPELHRLIGPPPHERRGRGLETRPLLTRTQSATARSQIKEIPALLCILENEGRDEKNWWLE